MDRTKNEFVTRSELMAVADLDARSGLCAGEGGQYQEFLRSCERRPVEQTDTPSHRFRHLT